MTEEEQEIIKKIIDKENDLNNLEQMRRWITQRAQLIQTAQSISPEYNVDILKRSFKKFIKKNLNTSQKKAFKMTSVIIRITNYRNLDDWRELKVYHAIGIGENVLKSQTGVGEKSIQILEQLLNQYGFSLNIPLTAEQEQAYTKLLQQKVMSRYNK